MNEEKKDNTIRRAISFPDEKDRTHKAIEYYTKLIEIDPNVSQAKFYLAQMYGKKNDITNMSLYLEKQIHVDTIKKKIFNVCKLRLPRFRRNKGVSIFHVTAHL